MFLNNLNLLGCLGGASAARTQSPKALPLPVPECTRLCARIDANSIVIKGAGSPFKEGSHLRIIHARQRSRIRIRL